MKKQKLNLDKLKVKSFVPNDSKELKGGLQTLPPQCNTPWISFCGQAGVICF